MPTLPEADKRTANERVLQTYELLEAIIFALPIEDLLFAKSVCSTWNALIESSPMLQEALHLRPRRSKGLTELPREPSVSISGVQNPLQRCSDPPHIYEGHRVLLDKVGNPLLNTFFKKLVNQPYLVVDYNEVKLPEPWQQDQSSWRNMLLTQPPLTRVVIQICHVGILMENWYHQGVVIRKESGVTAGNVVEKLRKLSRNLRVRFARVKGMDKWM